MKFNFFLFAFLFTSITFAQIEKNDNDLKCSNPAKTNIEYKLSEDEKIFLDTLQYYSFKYFIEESNYENGLVKDRSTKTSPSSITAVGFGIVSWAIGAEHNWITRKEAAQRTLNTLRFFYNSDQSPNAISTGYKGFYYHFLEMDSGKRWRDCELSNIDTGLLFGGIIFARQYYVQNNSVEKEIRKLAELILNRADWNFFVLPDTGKYGSLLSMGWRPEESSNSRGWDGYNEALIIHIIAAGTNLNNPQKVYKKWLSSYLWDEPYKDFAHVIFPPLFGHQYSHIFIDFRNYFDEYMKEKGIDYFENSRRATYTQQKYAIENPLGWKGYDSLTWGITACDGPGSKYNYDDKKFYDYAGRGSSGPKHILFDDGTIAPTAAGGSIPFAPEITIPTLMNMYKKYGSQGLWNKYGLLDAFNPTLNWYNDDYLGIDQGPIVLMIENFRNGFVWKYVMKDPIIQKGLKALGFEKIN
ncbi:MAG: glucoamylase family protein [Ignavibacterium sp.]